MVEINDLGSRRLQYFKSAVKTLKFAHTLTEDGLFAWKSRIYCKDTFKARESNLKGRWFERLGDFPDNLQYTKTKDEYLTKVTMAFPSLLFFINVRVGRISATFKVFYMTHVSSSYRLNRFKKLRPKEVSPKTNRAERRGVMQTASNSGLAVFR